jgi:hypothetical protein
MMPNVHRLVIAYIVAIPLALLLGFLIATRDLTTDLTSIVVLGLVFFFLSLPLLLLWHHWLLVFFWNSAFIAGFLPGELPLWIGFAALTFGIGVVDRIMGHRNFLRAPELTKPILFLAAVVIVTAKLRGGMGMRALGSAIMGGTHYVHVLGAIMGYFALTSQPISPLKIARAVKWFFLSGLTYGLTNLAFALGPAFYIMYLCVAVNSAYNQAAAAAGADIVLRFGGLGPVATAVLCFILARWGIRGIFAWRKPWRLLLLIAALAAGLFSGFRSLMAFLGVLFVVQFVIEGLWKNPLLPFFLLVGALCLMPVLLFANKMPFAVQRALAFLPIKINPEVRQETENSSRWRFEMWRVVLPTIPQYLLLGKGYSIDPTDLYLNEQAEHMGVLPNYSAAITAGNYHSGGLSLLIPFGAFGAAAFLWLLGAGVKVLYCNRRYGDPRLKLINDLFLSLFLTQCLCYFFVFGAFDTQLYLFLGILGMSVSLNGGVRRKETAKFVPATTACAMVLEPA